MGLVGKVDTSGDGGADKWLLRKEDFDGWFVPDNPYDMFRLAAEIANKKYCEEKAEKNRERRALREQETSERIERLRTVYWEAAEQRGGEEKRAQEQRQRRAERDRERRKRQRRAERDRERRKRQRREREAEGRQQGDGEKELFSAAAPPLLMEQPLQRVAADGQTHDIGDVLRPPARVKAYIEGVGGSDVGLVIDKHLTKTDVNPGEGRVSIPVSQVRTEFLTAGEKHFLGDSESNKGKPIPAMEVMLLQPNMRPAPIKLKRWDMRKGEAGKTNPMYLLGTGWNKVVEENSLKVNQRIVLWSFRCGTELRFALVRVN